MKTFFEYLVIYDDIARFVQHYKPLNKKINIIGNGKHIYNEMKSLGYDVYFEDTNVIPEALIICEHTPKKNEFIALLSPTGRVFSLYMEEDEFNSKIPTETFIKSSTFNLPLDKKMEIVLDVYMRC